MQTKKPQLAIVTRIMNVMGIGSPESLEQLTYKNKIIYVNCWQIDNTILESAIEHS